jgi:replicative DNA helicase
VITNEQPEPAIDLEQAVIGAVLYDNEMLNEIEGIVELGHFTEPLHQRIWEACTSRIKAGTGVNHATLRIQFEEDDSLAMIGGIDYLRRIESSIIFIRPQEAKAFAGELRARFDRRRLWQLGDAITYAAANEDLSLDDLTARVDDEISKASHQTRKGDNIRNLDEIVEAALAESLEAHQQPDGVIGVATGVHELDQATGGFRNGNFIVLAGRPGMGKSAAAISLAVGAAGQDLIEGGIAILSLEMNGEEIGHRIISERVFRKGGTLPYEDIARGKFGETDWRYMKSAQDDLADLPIKVEDTGRKSVAQIRSIAKSIDRGFQQEGGRLTCLIIDHIGLITSEGHRGNKVSEMESISNDLKGLAKSLHIPVIGLCQLNRGVEGREDKRPLLGDLRNSGAIEQDADLVIFTYRRAYYLEKNPPRRSDPDYEEWRQELDICKTDMDLIIAKNRHGAETAVHIACHIEHNALIGKTDEQEDFDLTYQ